MSENNQQLIDSVVAKAKTWLTDAYDDETRAEVRAMLDADDKTLSSRLSTATSSLAPVACAA